MRTGQNPSKTGIPAYQPEQLGIALLVYIPFLEGYFKDALEILKFQITSLHKNTNQPFDLLVFDNGSCSEVTMALTKLHDQGDIDWLAMSNHNLGKVGAWNWIFGCMPNELICYADSDVLFRRGWLEKSLEIINAFPNVGMVSAQPTFHDVLEGKGTAHLAFLGKGGFTNGQYIPKREIVEEYCRGIGASEELSERFYSMDLPIITDERSNTSAVIGATHMQFIIPGEVARKMIPLPVSKGLHRAETTALDRKIDESGYLHLSSQENFVMHMGNRINPQLISEIQELDKEEILTSNSQKLVLSNKSFLFRTVSRLNQFTALNQFFLRAYDFLYRALYVEKL